MEIDKKAKTSSKNESQMVPKPLQSDPWGCLGSFGDPPGAKRAPSDQKAKQKNNYMILGSLGIPDGTNIDF
jgi:hypothetical protein